MHHLEGQDMQLFVYLTWGAADNKPVLSDDQLRQAAYLSITTRTRSQFCHVLAIGGTASAIHLIARFPASFPVVSLVRVAREAATEALTRQQEILGGRPRGTPCPWSREYTACTLSAADAHEAKTYLRRRIAEAGLIREECQANSVSSEPAG